MTPTQGWQDRSTSLLQAAVVAIFIVAAGGCSTAGDTPQPTAARMVPTFENASSPETSPEGSPERSSGTSSGVPTESVSKLGPNPREEGPFDVYDPWEGTNRNIYRFNAQFDRYVYLPLLDAYRFVFPPIARDRVQDFFRNLGNIPTIANLVLQLKVPEAGETAFRFVANLGFGFGGIVDIATLFGMPQYDADFGQTLGVWGVTDGPYLVLPVMGPSNVRDASGTAVDFAAMTILDPLQLASFAGKHPIVPAFAVMNARDIQPFRYYESGSPFEYDLVRFFYTSKRQVEVGQ